MKRQTHIHTHTEPDSDPCVKENLLTELSTASQADVSSINKSRDCLTSRCSHLKQPASKVNNREVVTVRWNVPNLVIS